MLLLLLMMDVRRQHRHLLLLMILLLQRLRRGRDGALLLGSEDHQTFAIQVALIHLTYEGSDLRFRCEGVSRRSGANWEMHAATALRVGGEQQRWSECNIERDLNEQGSLWCESSRGFVRGLQGEGDEAQTDHVLVLDGSSGRYSWMQMEQSLDGF